MFVNEPVRQARPTKQPGRTGFRSLLAVISSAHEAKCLSALRLVRHSVAFFFKIQGERLVLQDWMQAYGGDNAAFGTVFQADHLK